MPRGSPYTEAEFRRFAAVHDATCHGHCPACRLIATVRALEKVARKPLGTITMAVNNRREGW